MAQPRQRGPEPPAIDSKPGATNVPSPGAIGGAGRCKTTRAIKQRCEMCVVDRRHRAMS